jgi:hypothetical protein
VEELAQHVSCSVLAMWRKEADELRPSEQLVEALAATLEIAPAEYSTFVRFVRDTVLAPIRRARRYRQSLYSMVRRPPPCALACRRRPRR